MIIDNTERAQVGWGFWLWWVLANIVGFAVGAAVAFAVEEAMGDVGEVVVGTATAAVIGASLGIAQWLVLRRQVARAGWWVLASTVGGAVGLVVYGAITGGVMVWLLRQPVTEEPSLLQEAA